ncbi:hypothetical protein Purlil1_14290 [Purpureocillium lilacinum]|uniref:Uncharacterized protein n=1 Tax=Purpureocillium lilacinum TaxID=33203 RepID=A0ABR0BBN9_PURLI|nr:hypothetical protein Purlil1_14290 [Purpureocillium lilacinum]
MDRAIRRQYGMTCNTIYNAMSGCTAMSLAGNDPVKFATTGLLVRKRGSIEVSTSRRMGADWSTALDTGGLFACARAPVSTAETGGTRCNASHDSQPPHKTGGLRLKTLGGQRQMLQNWHTTYWESSRPYDRIDVVWGRLGGMIDPRRNGHDRQRAATRERLCHVKWSGIGAEGTEVSES